MVLHLLVLLLHAAAHNHLGVGAAPWQAIFIAIVIFLAPVVAGAMLWTDVAHKAGLVLLGISMAASFFFGVTYHFIVAGPDNVFGAGHSSWNLTFQGTSVLLAAVEGAGAVWVLGVLRSRTASALAAAATDAKGREPHP